MPTSATGGGGTIFPVTGDRDQEGGRNPALARRRAGEGENRLRGGTGFAPISGTGRGSREELGCPWLTHSGLGRGPSARSGEDSIVQPFFDTVAGEVVRSDEEVVELSLLLPRWQILALEEAAHHWGMTTGQFIRKLLAEVLATPPALPPDWQ